MQAQSKPIIGIIILHYGEWSVTKECLDSLAQLDHQNFIPKIIVVDNSLNRKSQLEIKKHSTKPHLIVPTKNLGFAAGNNLAISYCRTNQYSYVLLLNNDTVVKKDFLEKLLELYQANRPEMNTSQMNSGKIHPLKPFLKDINKQQLFISGSIIEHKINHITLYDHGGYINWTKGQPKHINLTKENQILNSDKHPVNEQQRVLQKIGDQAISRDFISGCCMFIPMTIIIKIGLLDESFFMYLEDVEYCLRAQKNNIPVYINTCSHIFHKGSTSATEWLKIKCSMINSIKLALKYLPVNNQFSAILFSLSFYPTLYLIWKLKAGKRWLRGQSQARRSI